MEFKIKELLELKSKAQFDAIKKIDDIPNLEEFAEKTKYKSVKEAIELRIKKLEALNSHQSANRTKDGVTEKPIVKEGKKSYTDKEIADILRFHMYGPPLSAEEKRLKIDEFRKANS